MSVDLLDIQILDMVTDTSIIFQTVIFIFVRWNQMDFVKVIFL